MLQHYELENKLSIFKRWYYGYLFGKTEIYNPWSIITYVYYLTANPDAYPEAAWINSSSNNIIRELVNHANDYTQEAINLGYTNIIKYGIAFKGKFCCIVTE